ncbi:MAG: outer membrane protein transport protein [Candidatus Binatia bacterium]|nr:outer membrane protein transport protein [Candidatus Binatia bacterium]
MARLFVWIGRRVGAGSALTIMILAGATPANGAGLQLLEVSPRLTGTAYSGTAAWGADASMAYFNPAGLTLLEGGSFVASGYIIDLDLELTASKATTWGQNIPSESNVVDGGSVVAVPQFHFAQRISDEWVGYLGVTVPFGNDTNYPDDGVTRYVGTLSALRSISINPAIAWEPIEGLSVAAGFNAQVVRARINQKLAVPTLPIMQAYDINSRIFADDWAFGWNVGILYEITKEARVGVAYRSAIHHTLTGSVDLDLPEAPGLTQGETISGTSRMGISAPGSLIASGFWTPFEWIDVMADFQWTQWSIFQQLSTQLKVPDLPPSLSQLVGGSTINDAVYEGFRDGYRGTIGAQIRPADGWTVRMGSGFDGSPVNNNNRTLRLPDGNRVLLSFGFGYELLDNMFFDFGWSHFFLSDGTIDETNQTVDQSQIVATIETSADVFGAQFTYNWKNLPWQDLPF